MPDEDYLQHRGLVFRLAYDITGSSVDADDVVQQAYVRWRGVTTPVTNPRAYLARIATNLALDVVAERDRIGYVGTFLPEPVATGADGHEALAMADEVEIALMVVLGNLSPLERAAFLLHDVFSFSHDEIASMLDRTPDAVRQLASRARRHVAARRPGEVDDVSRAELETLTTRFLAAAKAGDVAGLQELLTHDVVFIGDGGGKRRSARRPVVGADKVARLFVGMATNVDGQTRLVPVEVNRRLALAIYQDDELDNILWFILRDGRICQALDVRNPDKLTGIAATGS